MSHSKDTWTDQAIDVIISNILRGGVILSALVVLAGGVLYLIRHGLESPDYHLFHGESSDLCNVRGIVKDALAHRARGIIQLGLLFLLATPILRVAFTVLAFAFQRDRTYVIVTLIVLAVLVFSLSGGGR